MLMIQKMTIIFRKTAPTSMENCSAPEIDFILFGILTTRAFQRVVNHSCGWSMSREICNQSWYDFANMMDFLCNINLLACFPFPSGQLVETRDMVEADAYRLK